MNKTLKNISRPLVFSFFLSSFFSPVFAQNAKAISKMYLQMGAGVGTFSSIEGGVAATAIIKNKTSISLSYHHLDMTPKNQPSDYQAETGYVLFIPYTYQATSIMDIVSVTAGKYYRIGKNIWGTSEGGLSYTKGEKINYQNTQSVTSSIIIATSITSNYTTTKETKSTVGVMLKSEINWAFASFMGLGAGVYGNFNAVQSPIVYQIKLLVGKMGKEKKHS
ncbi:MAG: hypothetical protein ABIP79_05825 [Chitinophagaceae bacterium]